MSLIFKPQCGILHNHGYYRKNRYYSQFSVKRKYSSAYSKKYYKYRACRRIKRFFASLRRNRRCNSSYSILYCSGISSKQYIVSYKKHPSQKSEKYYIFSCLLEIRQDKSQNSGISYHLNCCIVQLYFAPLRVFYIFCRSF